MQPFAWAGIVAVEKASASAAHPRMVLIGNTSLSLAASYSTAMFFGIVPKQLKWPLVSLDRMGVNLKTRVSPPGSAANNLPPQDYRDAATPSGAFLRSVVPAQVGWPPFASAVRGNGFRFKDSMNRDSPPEPTREGLFALIAGQAAEIATLKASLNRGNRCS